MHYKLTGKKSISIGITLLGIIASIVLFSFNNQSREYFIRICTFGTIVIVLEVAFLTWVQKRFFTSINILFISYVLFQFGIPLIYALNNNYNNPFLRFFDWGILANAVSYTLISIQVFSLSILLFILIKKEKRRNRAILFSGKRAMNDTNYAYAVGRVLFSLSTFIVLPLYSYIAYLSIINGFSQAVRSLAASNGVFNLARAFFAPSFFLLLCYGEKRMFSQFAKVIFFIVALESLMSGSRTDGILWVLVYVYFKNTQKGAHYRFSDKVKVAVVVGILGSLAVYIAQTRVGNTTEFTLLRIVEAVLGEMGFNFTSICFVMLYIPSTTAYQFGLTYFNSILCLVPRTLDFLNILEPLRQNLPTNWLWNMNHLSYGGILDFGVGFSSIGETYMNFKYFGLIVTFIMGYLLCKLFNTEMEYRNNWERYVQIVMLLALLTFPRRSFNEFLKSVEYSVLILGLIMITCYGLGWRNGKMGATIYNEN